MFDALMTHKVVPIRIINDNFGNETATELDEELGFFEYRERNTYDKDGNVVRSQGILFLRPETSYTTEYKNWRFRDVKNGRVLQGENSNRIDDPRTGETHHYEIELR